MGALGWPNMSGIGRQGQGFIKVQNSWELSFGSPKSSEKVVDFATK